MCAKVIKFASILIFVFFIFHGGCKTPFTPSESLPVIWVNTFSLSFNCAELGANPSTQVLQVKNIGKNTLSYTIEDDANFYDVDWLTVAPSSGSSSGQIVEHTITVDKTGMNARDGAYTAKITISSSEAYNNPQVVDVGLKIEKEPPPEIYVTPQTLTFSAKEGAVSNPSSQTLRVKNTGQQSLNYTISNDATWLNVTPNSGASTGGENTHSVSVNISGLSEGNYTGKITIADPNAINNPQTVDVTLTVSKKPPPVISVTPTSLSFSGKEGGTDPSPQYIGIKNSGEGTLNYSISDNANWLSVNPTGGSSTGGENTHTVSVNTGGLGEGTYNGIITITDSNAANNPQTVNVTLTVSKKPPPQIWVSPTSLTFSGKEGGTNPASQAIKIKNSGEDTLNYSISDDANWLSVNPIGGSSTGGENAHTVSVNIGGLGEGTYNGTITITDPNAINSPQQVGVTLTISKQIPPQISVTPTSLTFSGKEGGSNPSSQTIKIKNSGEGTLNYSISDSANWLSVNPMSGSSTGGENTHTVSVSIAGLSEGTYNGTITISDSNASNSPQTITVTLAISKEPPPTISVTPTSLTFSGKEGGSDPSSQTIRIRNSGQQILNYSISDNANWLSVNPTSGSSTGGENTHTVSVSISGLSEGTYNGTITISDSNASNSPQTVTVTLTLTKPQPPEISVTPTSLTFQATEGGSNPSSKTIKIRNTGEQTLNYNLTVSDSWLSVDPTNGSSTGGENPHTVSVNISGLSPGTYNGTITITDLNASNSPQTVNITLNIAALPSDNEISVSCSPNSGGNGTEVTVSINIEGNINEIKSYSLNFNYDENIFDYQGYSISGTLTESWGSGSAANKAGDGLIKVGGFGGTNSIPKGSIGTLIKIILKVNYSGGAQSTQISISNYDDDINSMTPEPASTTFNYQ